MNSDLSIPVGDALRLLRRGLLPGLLAALAIGYLAYVWSARQAPVYESQATVLASSATADLRSFGVPQVTAPALDVSAYEAAARSDQVTAMALTLMGVPDASDSDLRALRRDYSVRGSSSGASSLLTVTARSGQPASSAAIANAVAEALVTWDVQRASRSINQAVTSLEQQVASLTEQIRALQALGDASRSSEIEVLIAFRAQQQQSVAVARTLSASAIGRLEVLQGANAPTAPVAPRPLTTALLAALAGIALTYGALILKQTLDTRIASVPELQAVSGLPILAEFQRQPKPTRRLPRETASYLRTGVLFATADAETRVILVTSGHMGEGKSAVALNLAESFARNDYRTLLVDADLRQPVLFQEYGLRRGQASDLLDFLQNPDGAHMVARIPLGGKQRLDIVPSFQVSSQAAEVLGRGFDACVALWSQEYDVIVIDSPPVLAVADALSIAPFCTGTLLAVNMRRADRRPVRATIDLLERMGVRLLGIAATMVTEPQVKGMASYGYGYGAPSDNEPPPSAPKSEARVSVRNTGRRG